jgi:hypothetical protein
MATLNINGQNVQVDDSFLQLPHDQQSATVDEIASSLKATPSVGIGEDALKSVGSGLGSATISTLGGVGDIRSALSRGVDALGNKIGVDLSPVKTAASMTPLGALNAFPTSEQVRSTVKDPIVSPDYEPQTALGSVLKKGAEFAPNMLLGGPEGVGARLLTNVAAPAVGSALGEKVGGPIGGVVGALAGGAGATSAAQKFNQMLAARSAAKALPSAEDLLTSGSNKFEAVKGSDAIINPSSVEQMAKDIKTEMLNAGKHPTSEGQAGVFAALDRLEAMGKAPGGVTPKDMEVVRKNLVDLKPNLAAGPTARMAADKFMEKYSNLGANDLLNGSNPFPTLKDAIGDWAAGKRSNTIQGKVDLAKLNADTAGSGANGDNAMRQAIKQLARPMNNTNVPVARRLGFNNEEIAAIKQAATGSTTGNVARFIGKAAPTGIVSGALSGSAGHMAGGPVGAVAFPAVGYIAKKIGDLSTKRAVAAIDSLVRLRSPLAAQVSAQLPPQVIQQLPAKTQRLLQALVLADPVLSNQLRQQVSQPVAQ